MAVRIFEKIKSFMLKKAEAAKVVHQPCYVVAAVKKGWIFQPSLAPYPHIAGTRRALSLRFRFLANNFVLFSEKLKIEQSN